jgi:hypothetical protein
MDDANKTRENEVLIAPDNERLGPSANDDFFLRCCDVKRTMVSESIESEVGERWEGSRYITIFGG